MCPSAVARLASLDTIMRQTSCPPAIHIGPSQLALKAEHVSKTKDLRQTRRAVWGQTYQSSNASALRKDAATIHAGQVTAGYSHASYSRRARVRYVYPLDIKWYETENLSIRMRASSR